MLRAYGAYESLRDEVRGNTSSMETLMEAARLTYLRKKLKHTQKLNEMKLSMQLSLHTCLLTVTQSPSTLTLLASLLSASQAKTHNIREDLIIMNSTGLPTPSTKYTRCATLLSAGPKHAKRRQNRFLPLSLYSSHGTHLGATALPTRNLATQ